MEAKELIEDLRSQLAEVKKQDRDVVSIKGLEDYLKNMEADVSESVEIRRQHLQGQLAEFEARHKSTLELFKATVEAGKEALNSVILINGGAVVAILSFLGAVAVKGAEQKLAGYLTLPLLQFGLGVFSGSFAFGVRYLSQACYGAYNERWGNIFRAVAVVLTLAAYTSFAFGVSNAYLSFKWRFLP